MAPEPSCSLGFLNSHFKFTKDANKKELESETVRKSNRWEYTAKSGMNLRSYVIIMKQISRVSVSYKKTRKLFLLFEVIAQTFEVGLCVRFDDSVLAQMEEGQCCSGLKSVD